MNDTCTKISLTPTQIAEIFVLAKRHPNGSFEVIDDSLAGQRVVLVEVLEWAADATSEREAELSRYIVTSRHNGAEWLSEAVLL